MGNPQAFNKYAYVGNNPVKYIDPSGHGPEHSVAGEPLPPPSPPWLDQPVEDETYSSYGFLLVGFNESEVQALGGEIEAYADSLGGSAKLQELMRASNNGALVTINKDLIGDGADSDIRLGVATSYLYRDEPGRPAKYANYGAVDPKDRAQIVLGHEIGHRLFAVARARGESPGEKYAAGVSPNGRAAWADSPNNPLGDIEQEAVTNLALYVQDKDYTWSTYRLPDGTHKEDSTSSRAYAIWEWARGFMNSMK